MLGTQDCMVTNLYAPRTFLYITALIATLLEVQGVSRFVRGFQCKHLLFSTCDSKEEQQSNKAKKKIPFYL